MFVVILQCIIVLFSILAIKMTASDMVLVRAFGAFTQTWLQFVWMLAFILMGTYFVVLLSILYGFSWYNTYTDLAHVATRQGIHFANFAKVSSRLKKEFILAYFETVKAAFNEVVEDVRELHQRWKEM